MNNQDEVNRVTESYDAEQLLMALRKGGISEAEIVMAVRSFGQIHFLEARPEVEQLLASAQPAIRTAALETLFVHWKIPERIETAQHFLLDPDPACRKLAINYLQEEQAHSMNTRSLYLLARIADDTQETDTLRLNAYCALMTIAGFPLNAHQLRESVAFPESGQRLENISWIDWSFIALLSENGQEQAERTSILLGASLLLRPYRGATALSRDGNMVACISINYDGVLSAIEAWNLSQHQYQLLGTTERDVPEESDLQDEEYEGSSDEGKGNLTDLACWSFDGTHLAVARQEDGILDVWQVVWEQGQECRHVLSLQTGEGFRALAWGNRSLCFAAATGSELLYWEKPEMSSLERKAYPSQDDEFSLPGHERIHALAFLPDDTSLLTGDSGGKIFQWGLNRYHLSPGSWWYTKSHMAIMRLACSPDGARVAVRHETVNERDGLVDEATSIIYLCQNHVFIFGDGQFSDVLGWSPDGTLLVGLRHEDMLTEVFIELFDAFTGDLVASYDVSEQVLPALQIEDFTSFEAVLAPDGKRAYWCAKAHRWSYRPGAGEHEPIWYGVLLLPPVRRTLSTIQAFNVTLQPASDRPG